MGLEWRYCTMQLRSNGVIWRWWRTLADDVAVRSLFRFRPASCRWSRSSITFVIIMYCLNFWVLPVMSSKQIQKSFCKKNFCWQFQTLSTDLAFCNQVNLSAGPTENLGQCSRVTCYSALGDRMREQTDSVQGKWHW